MQHSSGNNMALSQIFSWLTIVVLVNIPVALLNNRTPLQMCVFCRPRRPYHLVIMKEKQRFKWKYFLKQFFLRLKGIYRFLFIQIQSIWITMANFPLFYERKEVTVSHPLATHFPFRRNHAKFEFFCVFYYSDKKATMCYDTNALIFKDHFHGGWVNSRNSCN